MPRQPRLVISGYPHHIILRGNNRSAIFYNDKDRRFFIECIKESKEKTKSKIYAYCLMTNHVHLLIEPSKKEGLGNMMQSLGRKYVQYINRTHKRTGTLWEGRFKSSVVSKDEYLLTCSRYIELNPVRAKIVKHPIDYVWSSFGFKAEGKQDALLDEDPIYESLGKTLEERQENYKEIFRENISERELSLIRNTTQKGGIFGNEKFLERITESIGRNVFWRARGRPKKSL
ncbi:MAG: transposase [Candidatus Omnitrophica bacterium]|nr:transposase [Candidatus Omnitrophota bacterium]